MSTYLLPLRSRLLVIVAACCTLGALALPLWRIDLDAPQYPEGIGMIIRAGTVEGVKPNDLQNINGLNHYIGMREIVPESIPELRWMPSILIGLALLGGVVALRGRKAPLVVWLVLFAATGVVGLADFWRWGYTYGHDLDPQAIIKIPGMVYQPPLIGSKQLLNFTAHSFPAAGGVLLGIAFLLGVGALLLSQRRPPSGIRATAIAASALLVACSPVGPRAIALGAELCAYCRMSITEARFGAQVQLVTGKTLVFDSVECLASFVATTPASDIADAWVTDFPRPGTFVLVGQASFWVIGSGSSPMGKGLVATTGVAPDGAESRSWDAIIASAREEVRNAGDVHAHATR